MITGKKILIVTTTDNMIWQFLLPHIKHLQDSGNTVECACNRSGFFFNELVSKFGLTVHEMNFTRFPFSIKNIKARKQLTALCREKNYDIFYCHQPVGGVMGRMMGKTFKKPVIYVAHGFHFFKGAPLQNNLIYKTIEKYYSKYTDALVTMNEEDFEAAKKFKAKKAYKISGIGVDLSKYKKQPENLELKSSLGISKEDTVVLSIGELNKNKNFKTVIESFALIKNPNIKYLICGQGPLKEEFEKTIKALGQENRIRLLGFRSDITDILNLSDIFVVSSFREGLPKAMMEAMAYELPVICSDIRGCHDLVSQNEGGILTQPTDKAGFAEAIEKLAKDKKLQTQMGKTNKENIQDYSIENVLTQMEKIYNVIFTK